MFLFTLATFLGCINLFRSHVDGVTIGFANEVRAAPALEAVVSAVTFGSKDRRGLVKALTTKASGRKDNTDLNDSEPVIASTQKQQDTAATNYESYDPKKSAITVISMSHQDFLGLDSSGETDACQGLMQSLIKVEWNGNGDYMSFASRAHEQWKEMNGLPGEDLSQYIPDAVKDGDTAASVMVAFLMVCLFAYMVQWYLSRNIFCGSSTVEKNLARLLRHILQRQN